MNSLDSQPCIRCGWGLIIIVIIVTISVNQHHPHVGHQGTQPSGFTNGIAQPPMVRRSDFSWDQEIYRSGEFLFFCFFIMSELILQNLVCILWRGAYLFHFEHLPPQVMQHITFNEWLPIILGPRVLEIFELNLLPRGFYQVRLKFIDWDSYSFIAIAGWFCYYPTNSC